VGRTNEVALGVKRPLDGAVPEKFAKRTTVQSLLDSPTSLLPILTLRLSKNKWKDHSNDLKRKYFN
jgi:hypothetical protein